ncbi:MAG: hypothetical protein HKM04_03735 [Legionellales bacterium]|nr:hypothetical protein [Legionellales bacterium]
MKYKVTVLDIAKAIIDSRYEENWQSEEAVKQFSAGAYDILITDKAAKKIINFIKKTNEMRIKNVSEYNAFWIEEQNLLKGCKTYTWYN